MTDYCKGCYSNVASMCDHYCSYTKYSPNAECPCSECIVKVMCNDPCDKFEEFMDNLEVLGNLKGKKSYVR